MFETTIPVEFNHVDAAGIVFYPRYYEMINATVERFFGQVAGWSFRQIHLEEGGGVPTAKVETEFHAPSRLGDVLRFTLAVERLGGASLAVVIRAEGAEQARLTSRQVLVHVNREGRPSPWPDRVRAKLSDFMEISDD